MKFRLSTCQSKDSVKMSWGDKKVNQGWIHRGCRSSFYPSQTFYLSLTMNHILHKMYQGISNIFSVHPL